MSEERTIRPVTRCGFVQGMHSTNPESYRSTSGSYSKPTSKTLAALFLRLLEEARAKDVAAHEANGDAMESNKLLAADVRTYMESIGMPHLWTEKVRTGRSMYSKTVTHNAGYLDDISRNLVTEDGYAAATTAYERLRQTHREYSLKADQEEAQAAAARERQVEADKAARRANIELATIILRYSLDIDSTWDDVLDSLTAKDARLNLAVVMQRCRESWEDGPKPVFRALYEPTTDLDREIVKSVRETCEDWDGDGRCFRDCTWSYTRIYERVTDQQLVTDVQLAMQRVER